MPAQLDLKKTLNLPRTDFSMKANLPTAEPRLLKEWEKMNLYSRIQSARGGRPTFILHDGPPYANGHIHLGHAFNKILKDIIVKSKTMEGYASPYLPGWDCHGLPIEIKVVGTKMAGRDLLRIRSECRQYAEKYIEIQKEEFKRLGIFGDWENSYLTMSNEYEAETVRLLGKFIEKGSVYKGLKPVHWCISCETALAEAEVEYASRVSPSVYVKFPVIEGASELNPEWSHRKVFILIWTTTPWTLPANLAICFHPDSRYSLVEVGDEIYIIAADLTERVATECQFKDYRTLLTVKGDALKNFKIRHPWLERDSKSLLARHVTLDQGTGAVHTAPGHGQEDYLIGIQNQLEPYCPVDDSGKFTSDVEHFSGLQVFEANSRINQFMREKGVLAASGEIEHSYPHCWRCHNPVIFRATPQWFISMEQGDLRKRSLQEIQQVQWIPSWGRERISNMIAERPDWCISRQRIWGVPITVFYCKACGEPLVSAEVAYRVADIFASESADAWYKRTPEELLGGSAQCPCGNSEFEKEYDILDVWFDSGVSHQVVLKEEHDLCWPADVYLEGGDQYRGWFHSSLLVAVGVRDAAPYRTVICNGWTLDEEGRAMSKSLGNVISPLDIVKNNGAEMLRLWVASTEYTQDARLGEEILARLREAYRKLRNTSRFLLGNLYDFEPSKAVQKSQLTELDRWALARMAQVAKQVQAAYQRFEFHVVYHALYNWSVVDLSSFYLDVLKDRLYTSAPESPLRRAAQTALFTIADTSVRLLAPILPFTAEEIWKNLYPQGPPVESVHMAEFSDQIAGYEDSGLLERWERFWGIRDKVTKALEESRQKKQIGNSLEASLTLRCGQKSFQYLKSFSDDLWSLFIVSEVELSQEGELSEDEVDVVVSRTPGQKCERCWTYSSGVGTHPDLPQICSRCYDVLKVMGELP